MAFQQPVGSNSYTKTTEVFTDSRQDKADPLQSDFNYTALLRVELQNIVGMTMNSWSIPRNAVPSFYQSTDTVVGNHSLDFSLENADVAGAAQVFSVTWPNKYYRYKSPGVPDLDYNTTLAKLMNDAISANATWKDKVCIETYAHSLDHTVLVVSVVDVTLPTTSTTVLKLLFASGTNAATASNAAMGFPVKADVTSSATTFYTRTGGQYLESPSPVDLRPFPYIDVFVEQSNKRPFQRIYIDDDFYTRSRSSEAIHQLHIDTDNPPRHIKQLDISIRYPSGVDPGQYISNIPHSFGISMTQLANEANPIPAYVKQNLAW